MQNAFFGVWGVNIVCPAFITNFFGNFYFFLFGKKGNLKGGREGKKNTNI